MPQQLKDNQLRAGGFASLEVADEVIRRLLAAGFTREQLVVICPPKFESHFRPTAPNAQTPSPDAATAVATGGIVGASLGGLALVATVLTGGAAGPAAVALIGGGTLAGGISSLIAMKGYDQEADDLSKIAVENGWIIVGVRAPPGDAQPPISDAKKILQEFDAQELDPAKVG